MFRHNPRGNYPVFASSTGPGLGRDGELCTGVTGVVDVAKYPHRARRLKVEQAGVFVEVVAAPSHVPPDRWPDHAITHSLVHRSSVHRSSFIRSSFIRSSFTYPQIPTHDASVTRRGVIAVRNRPAGLSVGPRPAPTVDTDKERRRDGSDDESRAPRPPSPSPSPSASPVDRLSCVASGRLQPE